MAQNLTYTKTRHGKMIAMKMIKNNFLFLLILLFVSFYSRLIFGDQTLVLIHGYLGDGGSWRQTGIVQTLHYAGWQDAGHLFPRGSLPTPIPPSRSKNYLYTITLPSEAPLAIQAQWLDFYLDHLYQRHPQNRMVLIGHSAGGVVARLSLVVNKRLPIQGLITIATPHLGTDKAEWGVWLNQTPLSWITPFIGLGTINRSENLYRDLIRESPTTPLFWLNRQPHPPQVCYVSIVRVWGDQWVPAYSQDMNDIPALRGKAMTLTTTANHDLHPGDGPLLVEILKKDNFRCTE